MDRIGDTKLLRRGLLNKIMEQNSLFMFTNDNNLMVAGQVEDFSIKELARQN